MRVFAFIDSQNLNLSVRKSGWRLDFRRFLIYLREKYNVERAYLFLGYVSKNEKLYSFLKRIGYVLIFKPTLKFRKNRIKGNCDAELVLHCMIEKDNYEKAIVVTGDGDFYCLVKYLENQNKLLKIGIPNSKSYSTLLSRFHKYFFYVDMLKKRLRYKK